MIFEIDRIQERNDGLGYIITEFFHVENIDIFISKLKNKEILKINDVFCLLNDIDRKKGKFLSEILPIDIDIIIYEESYNNNYKVILKLSRIAKKWSMKKYSFEELSKYFRVVNGSNTDKSKKLGSAKGENGDNYTNAIIKELNGLDIYDDDGGLTLTKALLAEDPTKGFDLDLFQYIESTNEFIFFEFLKRENKYVTNITAHPMRYCWNESKHDNKRKFIGLWKACEFFCGRLFLVNYSDNKNEKISISEIIDLDEALGIRHEYKYVMSYTEFIGWLKFMNTYEGITRDYLREFKQYEYNRDFFDKWNDRKKEYGIECNN